MVDRKKKNPKKRGRPALRPAQRKRNNVTMRMTDDLKMRLENSANDHGRSLSEEIEHIMERFFITDDHMALIFGDLNFRRFVDAALDAKGFIEFDGKSVWTDDVGKAAFKKAVECLVVPPDFDNDFPESTMPEKLGLTAAEYAYGRQSGGNAGPLGVFLSQAEAKAVIAKKPGIKKSKTRKKEG